MPESQPATRRHHALDAPVTDVPDNDRWVALFISTLPQSLYAGIVSHGVSPSVAGRTSHLLPVSTLFASFLGSNPVEQLIGPNGSSHLPPGTLLAHRGVQVR
jgi:hypothetical protein